MIISHKYKFIFIKTSKTAGTSIEYFLQSQCGNKDVITPIIPNVKGHLPRNYMGLFNPIYPLRKKTFKEFLKRIRDFIFFKKYYNHLSAHDIYYRTNRNIWNEYYIFCVERDPVSKTISMYNMLKNRGLKLDFDQYIAQSKLPFDYEKYIINGVIVADRILDYKHLNDQLSEVLLKLDIGCELNLKKIKSIKTKYVNKVNLTQKQLIIEKFKEAKNNLMKDR